MLLEKEVLEPGVYFAGGRWVEVTEDDLKSWVTRFSELKAANHRVPIPFEHPQLGEFGSQPVSAEDAKIKSADRARRNAGWVEKLEMRDGKLWSVLNVRKSIGKRLTEVGGFVSPHFNTWKDGKGKEWENSILHMALTLHPVNHDQSDRFIPRKRKSEAVAPVGSVFGISFSIQDKAMAKAHAKKPAEKKPAASAAPNPKPISESGSLGLNGVSMGDDGEGGGDDAAGGSTTTNTAESADPTDAKLREVVEEMAELGVILPKDWKGDWDVFCSALRSHKATKKLGGSQPAAGQQQGEESVSNVSMSVETLTEADLMRNPIAAQALTAAATNRKTGFLSRVDSLLATGRCTPAQADKIKAEINGHSFSSVASTEGVENSIGIRLSTLEELPVGAVANVSGQSGGKETEVPLDAFFSIQDPSKTALPKAEVDAEVNRLLRLGTPETPAK